jgi:2-(1,2-epoxy-1,2-dihydrophenyl)acetyl-CoA isomerase
MAPDDPDPAPAEAPDHAAGDAADHVVVTREGPVAWVRLDRPDKRNAMTRAMGARLRTVLADLAGDPEARVVVLTGTGSAFSSGADTKDLFGGGGRTGAEPGRRRDDHLPGDAVESGGAASTDTDGAAMLTERRSASTPIFPVDELVLFPKPTIAALNGVAVGGGTTMAMACDLRVCAASASLTFSLAQRGLTPEWGSSYLLWRQIGWSRTLDLMLTARTIEPDEALTMGLVSRVVPDAELLDAAQALAAQIASLPPGTAEECKHVLRAGLDANYHDARRIELRALTRRGRDLAAQRPQKEQSQQ